MDRTLGGSRAPVTADTRRIAPEQDIGFDLSREYEMAEGMHRREGDE